MPRADGSPIPPTPRPSLLNEWLAVVDAPDDETRVERVNSVLAKYTEANRDAFRRHRSKTAQQR